MNDLRVITFQDLLSIEEVLPAEGIEPSSIFIVGKDFRSALAVHVNDLLCPGFIVLTNHRILAQLPASLIGRIDKVEVASGRVTLTKVSRIEFGLGPIPTRTDGIEKLVQNFVKLLLQRKGSDPYNLEAGGDLLSLVGVVMTAGIESGLGASVSRGVDSVFRFMQKEQAKHPGIPTVERIASAQLFGLTLDPGGTGATVRIHLLSAAGEEATPSIRL